MEEQINVPDIVFIIPYRDRLCQKEFFLRYMKYILEDYPENSYEIVFSHQIDKRTFNRGAMKNIGFKYVKTKYPNNYQKITLVFNDIDCVPYIKNLIDYKTKLGMVKHFYGFEHALGGIISITCKDFEIINGFPNYWGWGFEDNSLKNRIDRNGIFISRKQFFNIGDNRILHLFDTFKKQSDKNIQTKFINDDGTSGLNTIFNLNNQIVNFNVILNHYMLNIKSFETEYHYEESDIIIKDMREKNDIYISKKNNTINNKNISIHLNNDTNNTNNINEHHDNSLKNKNMLNMTNIPSRKCNLKDGKCYSSNKNDKLCDNMDNTINNTIKKKVIRAGTFKFLNKINQKIN